MYCIAVGRDKPPGLYLGLSKLYTYLCKVDQSMALNWFSLFADGPGLFFIHAVSSATGEDLWLPSVARTETSRNEEVHCRVTRQD